MRYQIRLIDEDLRGLARELALACWRSADSLLTEYPPEGLYRPVYAAVRQVLRNHVKGYRLCGLGAACGTRLQPTELGGAEEWREKFPPEPQRIRIYLMEPDSPPSLLVGDLMRATLKGVVGRLPRQKLKGLARLLRRQIEKVLHGRVLRSDFCGEVFLCRRNEAFDAWDGDELLLPRVHTAGKG